MRRILYLLTILVLLAACGKEPRVLPEPPIPTDPVPQTVLMYLPWAGGSLYKAFENNIEDARKAVNGNILGQGGRLLVFLQSNITEGTMREFYFHNGKCQERALESYTELNMTRAADITRILGDMKRHAPADRYGIAVGSHGMAWLPASGGINLQSLGTPADGADAPAIKEREYWEYISPDGIFTRWFGDAASRNTDTPIFAQAIAAADIHFEYILFDVCFMSSVEVAYDLRSVALHIVGSPCEVMGYGFPYATCLPHLFTNGGTSYDLEGVCRSYHDFYETYIAPNYNCGAIAVTVCGELERLAGVMKRINAAYPVYQPEGGNPLQIYDTYSPTRFFDYGNYVSLLCRDAALRSEFDQQIERTVPSRYRFHTDYYYSNGKRPINAAVYTGITTSDPSTSTAVVASRNNTAWYAATH